MYTNVLNSICILLTMFLHNNCNNDVKIFKGNFYTAPAFRRDLNSKYLHSTFKEINFVYAKM